MPWQLVFTSAPAGLTPGRSGFCTVARDEDMRERLAVELERLSAFDNAQLPEIGAVFFYRRLLLGSDSFYVLSRVCRAGMDYTQRANILAHHLVFSNSETALLANKVTPAEVALNWPKWVSQWPGSPRYFELREKIQLPELYALRKTPILPARTWDKLTGNARNAAILTQARSLYLEGARLSVENILRLYAESAALLPTFQTWRTYWCTHLYDTRTPVRWSAHSHSGALPPEAQRLNLDRALIIPSEIPNATLVRAFSGKVLEDAEAKKPAKPDDLSVDLSKITAPVADFIKAQGSPEKNNTKKWIAAGIVLALLCALFVVWALEETMSAPKRTALPAPAYPDLPPMRMDEPLPPIEQQLKKITPPKTDYPAPSSVNVPTQTSDPREKIQEHALEYFSDPLMHHFDEPPRLHAQMIETRQQAIKAQLPKESASFAALLELADLASYLPQAPALIISQPWKQTASTEAYRQYVIEFETPDFLRACFNELPPRVTVLSAGETFGRARRVLEFEIDPHSDYAHGVSLLLREPQRAPENGFVYQLDFLENGNVRLLRRQFFDNAALWQQIGNAPLRQLDENFVLRFENGKNTAELHIIANPKNAQPLTWPLRTKRYSPFAVDNQRAVWETLAQKTLAHMTAPQEWVFELYSRGDTFNVRSAKIENIEFLRARHLETLSEQIETLTASLKELDQSGVPQPSKRAELANRIETLRQRERALDSKEWFSYFAPWTLALVRRDNSVDTLPLLKFN